MKTEWWYDDASLHYSDNEELVLARLLVRDDGTARILTDGGEVIELESADEALSWLLSEEYRRLEDLIDDFKEEGRPLDPRIKVPTGDSDGELLRQMVIDLRPMNGPVSPNQDGSASAREPDKASHE